jgi:L,D-transpeptidase ErfK/SrfK
MRRSGKPVQTVVPPGPDNPLGGYWLGLAPSTCGLHATNAPASIYSLRTHGCIRLHPDDAAALFERSGLGDPVRIVYEPVLLAALADGRICLEVNPDAYGRAGSARASVERWIAEHDLGARVDRARVDEVIARREGLAFDVTADGRGGLCTPHDGAPEAAPTAGSP